MLTILLLFLCIGAGIIGGVFFAFSTFVMKAITQLPATQGIAAMQRINVVVINPLFLGVFMGTAALAVICVFAWFFSWSEENSFWLLAAGLFYAIGSFGVTMVCNVPRNDRLARMAPDSAQAATYWPVYIREWLLWNHVRTVASILSSACAAMALIQ